MNGQAASAVKRIYDELSGKLSPERVRQLEAEMDRIETTERTYKSALRYSGSASPYESGNPAEDVPGGMFGAKSYDGFGAAGQQRVAAPSPLHLSADQIKGLFEAGHNRMNGFQVQIGHKGLESGFGVHMKTAGTPVATSGFGTNLPAIMVPNEAVGLPYEPARIMGNIPTVAMIGPSAAYLRHTGNTNEAYGVDQLAVKPNIGPQISEEIIYPQKIAGLVSASMESEMDYPDFAKWLPSELSRSVINAESLYLLQAGLSGGPSGAAFTGLLAQTGILTRAVGSDTPLDALNKSFVDLRTGSAFAEPDLVICHPETLGALRREKDSMGRYILDSARGPAGIDQRGESADIWGVRVIQSSQMPTGQALVMSVASGAAIGWIRMGMVVQWNPWGDAEFSQNFSTWRAESRISLSCPRPAANLLLTGMPVS